MIAGISDAPMDALANELRRDDLPVDVVHVDLADQTSIAALVAATAEAERVAIAAGIFTSAPALETTRKQIKEDAEQRRHPDALAIQGKDELAHLD